MFSILDQKQAEVVRSLQERSAFLSGEDFINALEYNIIEGQTLEEETQRQLMKYVVIVKVWQMVNSNTYEKASRRIKPSKMLLLEYHQKSWYITHTYTLVQISRDIRFIHFKTIFKKLEKRVQNGLKSIILDYEAREFKITSKFTDNSFKPLIKWMRQDLHVYLITCATELLVTRAKNTISFVKERVRYIQSETPVTKFLERLTSERVKWITVLIISFNRKFGLYPVMSPRQILFGKKLRIHCVKLAIQ